ncbi:hypothetical protein ACFE04_021969 [Oxalis oulophora]
MKKNSLSLTSFPSPNFQKGWSSERVPHPSSSASALSNGNNGSNDDEKLDLDEMKDAKTMVSDFPSRRDMATQMSRENSTNSSPGERSSSLAIRPVVESQNDHPAAMEIKEVQVDKRVTITSWSKRHGSKTSKKRQPEFFQNSTGMRASSWDITNTTVSLSR